MERVKLENPGRAALAGGVIAVSGVFGLVEAGMADGPEGPPQWHFGLPNQPVGAATLSTGSDGRLVVSNIGSSGKDGVSIDLGIGSSGEDGVWFDVDFGQAGALAIDSRAILKAYFETGDVPTQQQFCNLIEAQPDGSAVIGVEYIPIGLSCARVELFLNGALVDSLDFDAPLPPAIVSGNIGSSGKDGVLCSVQYRETDFNFVSRLLEAQPQLLTITGSPTGAVLADEIVITCPSFTPVKCVSGECTAANVSGGVIELHMEGIIHRDIATRAKGQAHMQSGGDHLTISNIGSSGEDGVSMVLPEVDDEVLVSFHDPVLLDGAPPAVLSVEAGVILDGPPLGPPIGARMTAGDSGGGGGGRLAIEYDTGLQATAAIVEVYNAGSFVGAHTMPLVLGGATDLGGIGQLTTVTVDACQLLARGRPNGIPDEMMAMNMQFSAPIEYQPPGAAPMTGDQLRILAEGSPLNVRDIAHIDLCGTGLPAFSIGDITRLPPNPTTVALGIEHEDIGNASAQLDPSGHLTVSNIGSSGKDGVSIDVGEAGGWSGTFRDEATGQGLDLGQPGMSFEVVGRVRDQFGNPSLAGCAFLNTAPSAATMTPSLDAPPGQQVEVTFVGPAGEEIHTFNMNDASVITLQTAPGTGAHIEEVKLVCRKAGGTETPGEPVEGINISLEQIPGGGGVTAQGPGTAPFPDVHIIRITRPIGPPENLRFTDVELTAANIPSFTLYDEGIIQSNVTHRSLGASGVRGSVCASHDHLVVSNIGSSGKDGVSIDLDPPLGTPEGEVPHRFVLEPTHSVDHALISTFEWRQLDGPTAVGGGILNLAGTDVRREAGVYALDWNSLPDEVTVRVLDDGAIVNQVTGLPPGPAVAEVFTPTLPGRYEFELVVVDNATVGVLHRLVWDADVDMGLPNGLPATPGDTLEITVKGEGESVGLTGPGFTTLELAVAADEEAAMILSEESVTLLDLCPADLNGDDTVNVIDLLAMLTAWGPNAGHPADLNGDGTVNVLDLLMMLTAWGTC